MSWFGLNPQEIIDRSTADGVLPSGRSLTRSLVHGALGFTLVSIAGFAPWAVFGRPLHRAMGEAGLYAVCAAVFIGLSGLCLHKLILGPGSLSRFYAVFAVAFTAYAIAWIAAWMSFGGHLGSALGLLAGTLVMAWLLVLAFDAKEQFVKVAAALFILNAIGYFAGGVVQGAVASLDRARFLGVALQRSDRVMLANLLWGVCYGLGFGAGLGLAFHFCQTKVRHLLRSRSGNEADL